MRKHGQPARRRLRSGRGRAGPADHWAPVRDSSFFPGQDQHRVRAGLEQGACEDGGLGAGVRYHSGLRHRRVRARGRLSPRGPGRPEVHGDPAG
ncbi:unnamed protein product, partial [Ectocarpus sp. 13 AM-2016]